MEKTSTPELDEVSIESAGRWYRAANDEYLREVEQLRNEHEEVFAPLLAAQNLPLGTAGSFRERELVVTKEVLKLIPGLVQAGLTHREEITGFFRDVFLVPSSISVSALDSALHEEQLITVHDAGYYFVPHSSEMPA